MEANLERAFELFSSGRISIDAYLEMVAAEDRAVDRKRAELRARLLVEPLAGKSNADAIAELEQASSAIKWCQDWAASIKASPAPNS